MELENLNLQSLTIEEMKQTEGGSLFLICVIVGAIAAIACLVATKNGGQDVDCPPETPETEE